MKTLKTAALTVALITVLQGGCAGVTANSDDPSAERHGVPVPSPRFVGPEDKELWAGDMDGRATKYYRLNTNAGIQDVIVVIQDELPEFFKRIEFLDAEGDGTLDLLRMSIYEKARGWRDVGITKENRYGLEYADKQFKGLLEKINEQQHAGK